MGKKSEGEQTQSNVTMPQMCFYCSVLASLPYTFMVAIWLLCLQTSCPRPEEEEGSDQWFSLSQALVETGSLFQELLSAFHLPELPTRGAENLNRREES